ncbi:MAG: ATP-binding cassette domain-containing protein [bacterium]
MADEPLIELAGIVKRYGERTVLEVERLAIEKGSMVAVVGPNGSGKTTLLKIINRLLEPDAGTYRFEGFDAIGEDDELGLQRRMTYVSQSPLMLTTSVAKNVAYGLKVRGTSGVEALGRMREALERVGLAHLADRRATTLSGGETQRLAIARALAIEPEVLLLDEPTAHVDRTNREVIEEIIRTLHTERDTTICFTTHDMAQAYRLTETFHTLVEGRLVEVTHENHLDGVVEETPDGVALFRFKELVLEVETAKRGPAIAAVDPGGIILAPSPVPTSARNCLKGTVTAMAAYNDLVRVTVEAGVSWTVLVNPDSVSALDLKLGSPVYCVFHSSAIQVF